MRKKIIRSICALLLNAFIIQDLCFAAGDLKPLKLDLLAEAKPKIHFALPESIAQIEDAWQAPRDNNKTFFLFQDAHTNESGQFNLSKALDIVLDKEDIQEVFLEAGFKDSSLPFFKQYGTPKTRAEVTSSFVKQGLMHGEEYLYLSKDKDFSLWGVEDFDLYKRSIQTYQEVAKDRAKYQDYLKRINQTLHTLSPRLLNERLLAFNQKHLSYQKAELSITDYFEVLQTQSRNHEISLQKYSQLALLRALKRRELSIHSKSASPEHKKAMELRRIQKLSKKIKAKELLKELDSLEEEIFKSLTLTPDEKTFLLCQKNLRYLSRLLDLSLTPQEFDAYKSLSKDFTIQDLTGFLNKKILDLQSYYERALFLEEGYEAIIQRSEDFYILTYQRDIHFIRESLKRMNTTHSNKAVLITGGYHTPNLKALLKTQGISYISITPQVLKETNKARYEKLLLNQDFLQLNPTKPMTVMSSGARLAAIAASPYALRMVGVRLSMLPLNGVEGEGARVEGSAVTQTGARLAGGGRDDNSKGSGLSRRSFIGGAVGGMLMVATRAQAKSQRKTKVKINLEEFEVPMDYWRTLPLLENENDLKQLFVAVIAWLRGNRFPYANEVEAYASYLWGPSAAGRLVFNRSRNDANGQGRKISDGSPIQKRYPQTGFQAEFGQSTLNNKLLQAQINEVSNRNRIDLSPQFVELVLTLVGEAHGALALLHNETLHLERTSAEADVIASVAEVRKTGNLANLQSQEGNILKAIAIRLAFERFEMLPMKVLQRKIDNQMGLFYEAKRRARSKAIRIGMFPNYRSGGREENRNLFMYLWDQNVNGPPSLLAYVYQVYSELRLNKIPALSVTNEDLYPMADELEPLVDDYTDQLKRNTSEHFPDSSPDGRVASTQGSRLSQFGVEQISSRGSFQPSTFSPQSFNGSRLAEEKTRPSETVDSSWEQIETDKELSLTIGFIINVVGTVAYEAAKVRYPIKDNSSVLLTAVQRLWLDEFEQSLSSGQREPFAELKPVLSWMREDRNLTRAVVEQAFFNNPGEFVSSLLLIRKDLSLFISGYEQLTRQVDADLVRRVYRDKSMSLASILMLRNREQTLNKLFRDHILTPDSLRGHLEKNIVDLGGFLGAVDTEGAYQVMYALRESLNPEKFDQAFREDLSRLTDIITKLVSAGPRRIALRLESNRDDAPIYRSFSMPPSAVAGSRLAGELRRTGEGEGSRVKGVVGSAAEVQAPGSRVEGTSSQITPQVIDFASRQRKPVISFGEPISLGDQINFVIEAYDATRKTGSIVVGEDQFFVDFKDNSLLISPIEDGVRGEPVVILNPKAKVLRDQGKIILSREQISGTVLDRAAKLQDLQVELAQENGQAYDAASQILKMPGVSEANQPSVIHVYLDGLGRLDIGVLFTMRQKALGAKNAYVILHGQSRDFAHRQVLQYAKDRSLDASFILTEETAITQSIKDQVSLIGSSDPILSSLEGKRLVLKSFSESQEALYNLEAYFQLAIVEAKVDLDPLAESYRQFASLYQNLLGIQNSELFDSAELAQVLSGAITVMEVILKYAMAPKPIAGFMLQAQRMMERQYDVAA